MNRPSDAELKQALKKAENMRAQGDDPDCLAMSLLSLNARFENWQKVIDATRHYLHSGLGTMEHARLVKVLREVEAWDESDRNRGSDNADFGLE